MLWWWSTVNRKKNVTERWARERERAGDKRNAKSLKLSHDFTAFIVNAAVAAAGERDENNEKYI